MTSVGNRIVGKFDYLRTRDYVLTDGVNAMVLVALDNLVKAANTEI